MESSVLKTEADFFPNSWFDHHGVPSLSRNGRIGRSKMRKRWNLSRFNGHLITSDIGSFKLLKENGPLWAYFQQFLYEEYIDLSIEDSF